jgi:DNA polymerase
MANPVAPSSVGMGISYMTGVQSPDPGALQALLRFYVEAGVDAALSEAPVDHFARTRDEKAKETEHRAAAVREQAATSPRERAPERDQATAETTRNTRAPANLAVPSEAAIMAAREAAAGAESLEALRATLADFQGCNLRATATNLVFADGNPQARIMFVGEAPGFEEDIQGLPFVGRSGQLLDRMLASIGLDRTSAYIANVIPWRPPGNRTPTPQETEICRPFIERQIFLADPDILVMLGGASAKQLLKTSEGILKLRGQWRPFDTGKREIRALATLHPAYLLRQPLQKRLAWRDLLMVKKSLDG